LFDLQHSLPGCFETLKINYRRSPRDRLVQTRRCRSLGLRPPSSAHLIPQTHHKSKSSSTTSFPKFCHLLIHAFLPIHQIHKNKRAVSKLCSQKQQQHGERSRSQSPPLNPNLQKLHLQPLPPLHSHLPNDNHPPLRAAIPPRLLRSAALQRRSPAAVIRSIPEQPSSPFTFTCPFPSSPSASLNLHVYVYAGGEVTLSAVQTSLQVQGSRLFPSVVWSYRKDVRTSTSTGRSLCCGES